MNGLAVPISWIVGILLLHAPARGTIISTFANGVKNWGVEVTNWNDDRVLCWLCTDANKTKKKERKIVDSRTCIVLV